jgi:hypothetical protein
VPQIALRVTGSTPTRAKDAGSRSSRFLAARLGALAVGLNGFPFHRLPGLSGATSWKPRVARSLQLTGGGRVPGRVSCWAWLQVSAAQHPPGLQGSRPSGLLVPGGPSSPPRPSSSSPPRLLRSRRAIPAPLSALDSRPAAPGHTRVSSVAPPPRRLSRSPGIRPPAPPPPVSAPCHPHHLPHPAPFVCLPVIRTPREVPRLIWKSTGI